MARLTARWLDRWRDQPIVSKLSGIVVVFLIAMLLVLGAVTLAFRVTTGVRAYINGEGLWSKGEKDAVVALSRYLLTHDEADYQGFLHAIAVPLGDRQARLELLKPAYDASAATEGFIAGGNAPEDIPAMIFLFRNFGRLSFFAEAIQVWGDATLYVEDLQTLGDRLHAQIQAQTLDAEQTRRHLDRIDQINLNVSSLERRFSTVLGQGARTVQTLLLVAIIALAVLLVALGLSISYLIAADLRASIAALQDGAVRVSHGDLEHRVAIRAHDELGELAIALNGMIARRQDSEIALTAANEFRLRVMESATNAIYTLDVEGRFTTANRRTCEITGYPLEELIGMHWSRVIPADQLPGLESRYRGVIEHGEPILSYEVSLLQKQGGELPITFSVAALRRAGTIFGVVGAAEDISERKRAEAELQARAEELVRSNRELEQFAYVASHDLQEPLRTVAGFAQLLAKRYQGKLDPDADEYIGYVTSGVQRMKSLIQDLLAYSRVTRAPAEPEHIALDEVMANALANLRGAIEAAEARVEVPPLPVLPANPRQMTQLFQNLIGNAIKFRRDEVSPVVSVSVEREGDNWHLHVRDNGIGIDPKHADQVFGLFQRLHGREKYAGNGIGLTICKKIVDLHRGRIWVAPAEPGPGTEFNIVLPA